MTLSKTNDEFMISLLFMLFMWLTDKHQAKQHQCGTTPP
jgi:hypothetical protein